MNKLSEIAGIAYEKEIHMEKINRTISYFWGRNKGH